MKMQIKEHETKGGKEGEGENDSEGKIIRVTSSF